VGALLDDVDRIAASSVARMQRLLASYAKLPPEQLTAVTITKARALLEAVRASDADRTLVEDPFRVPEKTRAGQGIPSEDMLQACRIVLEVMREEAHSVARRLGIADDVLLGFVEASLQWGDIGIRASALACREAEIRELERVAAEQAALRRIATLVAEGAAPTEVFENLAQEVAQVTGDVDCAVCQDFGDGTIAVLGAWGDWDLGKIRIGERFAVDGSSVFVRVRDAGGRYRTGEHSTTSGAIVERGEEYGIHSAGGCPIVVGGRVWGVVVLARYDDEPLPPESESRIAQFAELAGTAVANFAAQREVARLADEQTALRRVATLVAEGGPPNDVFDAVAVELADVLRADYVVVCRYELDSELTVLAHRGTASLEVPWSTRMSHDGGSVEAVVWRTGWSARLESCEGVPDTIADLARAEGVEVTLGAPVVVAGRLWGVATVGWNAGQSPPTDTEDRMARFAELLATGIANADSTEALRRLADEQAALRRVATLVAEGAPPTAVFDAVIVEIERLLSAGGVTLLRYEPDDEATVLAHRGPGAESIPPGSRVSHADGESATAIVWRTKRPARHLHADEAPGAIPAIAHKMGLRAAAAAPLVVEGKLWGCVVANWPTDGAPPIGTEKRMAKFAALLATAIANAESSEALRRLADEQGSLRRVATLVAEGAPPTAVFDAVAAEMATLLGADGITLVRYEPEDEVTVVAHRGPAVQQLPPGTRVRHDGASVSATVRRTQRPARMESYADTHGHIGEVIEGLEYRSGVGAPIVVDGRLWGATIASWTAEEPPPPGTEDRLAEFAELLDTAIANADSGNQLAASRARLVTEADDARRRVVRDLHDGAQQRLLQTIVTLGLAQRALEPTNEKARGLVEEALAHARQGNAELRELARGILPGVLIQAGLRGGISSIVSRLDIPVEVDVPSERFPPEIEASAYFVAAEALTNVVKHSHAERAWVTARIEDRMLRIEVRDDGVGGADPDGHGLVGLRDRVTAISGQLVLETPEGGGTLLSANLPVSDG
jgi:signal transduction histidine kinase